MSTQPLDAEIADFLAECTYDPLKYVMGAFPWTTDSTIQKVPLPDEYKERFPGIEYGPDMWQCKFLDNFGAELKDNGFDGKTAVPPIRRSTVTGHDTGKSTLVAWLTKFILDTRPLSVGTVTANTNAQLRTKTWAEVGKWHNISITEHWFTYTASSNTLSLVHIDKKLAGRWKCFAYTCDPGNSESFAGQHADATSFYIFDEASNIDDVLFEVREGGLISGEPMVFDFGNGTRNTGRFFENCVGRFKDLYKVLSIDSRDVYRVGRDNAKIAEDVQVYGEDSDYFRVRWRGLFPKRATTQFIGSDLVRGAQERVIAMDHKHDPLVFGVDVARWGDDSSVVYPRIGYDARSFLPRKFKGYDSTQVAEEVAQYVQEFKDLGIKTAMVFVDGGGGYGGGVVDQLKRMNIPVTEVAPGAVAINNKTYRYRSDEIWGNLKEALPKMALPAEHTKVGDELYEQLTQREYGHTLKQQVKLEPKDAMRDRIGSPDTADALAFSFARPVINAAGGVGSTAVCIKMKQPDPYAKERR